MPILLAAGLLFFKIKLVSTQYKNVTSSLPVQRSPKVLNGNGLEDLISNIQEVNPTLTKDKYVLKFTNDINPNYQMEGGEIDKSDETWDFSPNLTMATSIYQSSDGPDRDLYLYNRGNNKKLERLAFCGTPCEYWGTVWIDDTSFAFVWVYEDQAENLYAKSHLYLDIFDLNENTITRFSQENLDQKPAKPDLADWQKQEAAAKRRIGL